MLLRYGLHPRLLASTPALLLCVVYAILFAIKPPMTSAPASALGGGAADDGGGGGSGGGAPLLLLRALWLLLLAPALALGGVYAVHWTRRHGPSSNASDETWVPWFTQQLARGMREDELKEYAAAALPLSPDRNAHIDAMLRTARARL